MAYIEMKKRELIRAREEAHRLEDIYDDLNSIKRSATEEETYLDKLKLDTSILQEEVDYICTILHGYVGFTLFEVVSEALEESSSALHKASRYFVDAKTSLNMTCQEFKAEMLKANTEAIKLRDEVQSLEERL